MLEPQFLLRLRAHLGLCYRVVLQGSAAQRVREQSEPLRKSRRGRHGGRENGRHLLLGEARSSRSSSGRGCSGNCSGRAAAAAATAPPAAAAAAAAAAGGTRLWYAALLAACSLSCAAPDTARLHTGLGESGPGTVLLRRQSRMHGPATNAEQSEGAVESTVGCSSQISVRGCGHAGERARCAPGRSAPQPCPLSADIFAEGAPQGQHWPHGTEHCGDPAAQVLLEVHDSASHHGQQLHGKRIARPPERPHVYAPHPPWVRIWVPLPCWTAMLLRESTLYSGAVSMRVSLSGPPCSSAPRSTCIRPEQEQ